MTDDATQGVPSSWRAETDGLTAADVMHPTLSSLPAASTVEDVRGFFAASTSRRLAVFADGDRYLGALTPETLADDADPATPAADLATREPTIDPAASAAAARDLALAQPSRRLPVVDAAGRLLGVVAIDKHLARFCG